MFLHMLESKPLYMAQGKESPAHKADLGGSPYHVEVGMYSEWKARCTSGCKKSKPVSAEQSQMKNAT